MAKIKVRLKENSPYSEYGYYRKGDIGYLDGYTNGLAVIILENGEFAKANLDWINVVDEDDSSNTEKDVQKPAEWSEEDEKMICNLQSELSNLAARKLIKESTCDKYYNWLKSLKERVQPKQEWSEEDEENFARVDYACLKVYGGDSYSSDWLRKFLGIHKKWKPSDEQMEYLAKAILTLGNEGDCKTASILNELRTNLKELKDEK